MGLFNWFRRKSTVSNPSVTEYDSDPDTIPFPALGMADSPQVCVSVRLTDTSLFVTLLTGSEWQLDLHLLDRVAIRTTDEGDWTPDVFWIVSAGPYTCVIPQGISGEADLFNHLIRLPGFDKETMISAISSTENSEFECWKRD